jgi:periplasmic divalent cation tolerance protein
VTDHVQVLTTVGSEEDAERISIALIERRLAACVQTVGPVASRYRWQGAVETARSAGYLAWVSENVG